MNENEVNYHSEKDSVDYVKGETAMTGFEYKITIEMVYQILKANFDAGKTPEEVLAIIAALKNEPGDGDGDENANQTKAICS